MSLRAKSLAALLLAAAACAVNPATGERQLNLVSRSQEIQMGREADSEVVASMGLVEDSALQAYVSGIGMRLSQVSERPDLPWSYKVVDDPVVNAFALPGGFVYITRGILAYFEDEAELAGVLGHETGHVTAQHSVNQISRQQLQQLGLGVGAVLSPTVAQYGGLLGAGLQLLNLKYSRADETQADELGLRYMSRLRYDPQAMIGVFEMLSQVSGTAESRIPEWQSTHPYPENREAHMQELIAADSLPPGGRVGRDVYLDHIDGLVYGDNPREGYFKDTRFLHPGLELELTFPPGWSTQNQRDVVGAVAPSQDAVVMLQVAQDAQSPEAALRDFLAQDGVQGGPIRQDGSGEVTRVRAEFDATTSDGTLSGEAAFIGYDGGIYRVLGYSTQASWGRYASAVATAISSFRPLTDPAVLAVQPWRIDVVALPSAMSLQTYVRGSPGPVDLEELARLNRVQPAEVLSAGRRIKRIVGSPLP